MKKVYNGMPKKPSTNDRAQKDHTKDRLSRNMIFSFVNLPELHSRLSQRVLSAASIATSELPKIFNFANTETIKKCGSNVK